MPLPDRAAEKLVVENAPQIDRPGISNQTDAPSVSNPRLPGNTRNTSGDGPSGAVLYARGPISGLPEEHNSRRERFQELDELQAGWTVELRMRDGADTVDAYFYDPEGNFVKSYAAARRSALQHKKQQP